MLEFYKEVLDKPLNFRDPDVYVKYRKLFGYATSGIGRTSRDNLYGTSLKSYTKYMGHNEKNQYIKEILLVKIKKLYNSLDENITSSFNLDSLLKDLKQNTYKR